MVDLCDFKAPTTANIILFDAGSGDLKRTDHALTNHVADDTESRARLWPAILIRLNLHFRIKVHHSHETLASVGTLDGWRPKLFSRSCASASTRERTKESNVSGRTCVDRAHIASLPDEKPMRVLYTRNVLVQIHEPTLALTKVFKTWSTYNGNGQRISLG